MATTPILALPYPLGTDRVMDGDDAIRALAEAVEAKMGLKAGATAGTTDANGNLVIVHGLGVAPRAVIATTGPPGGSGARICHTFSPNATNFTIVIRTDTGANVVSTAVTVWWVAFI